MSLYEKKSYLLFRDTKKSFDTCTVLVASLLLRKLIRAILYCHGHRALLMFTILFESFGNEITKPLICFRVFTRLSVLHRNQMWHFSNQFVTIFHVYMLEVDKIARINLRKSRLDLEFLF